MMELIAVYKDGRIEKVSPHAVVSRLKKENGYIVVEYGDFFDPQVMFEYPGLIDVDLKNKEFKYTFKSYRGTRKPRLYPKCFIIERGLDYLIVQRHDGVLFKINHAFPSEILLNIINNPGISLWDLISIEVAIMAKEYPDLSEEEAIETIEATVEIVGYYVYILTLADMRF